MGSDSKTTFWSTYSDFNLNMGEREKVQNGKKLLTPKVIRFVDGVYSTNDPEEIAALRACSIYGHKLHEEDPSDQEALAAAQKAFQAAGAKKKPQAAKSKLSAAFNPQVK